MKRLLWTTLIIALVAGSATVAGADHSWGGYHWSRGSNPKTLTLIDSVTSQWDTAFNTARTDWSKSEVISLVRASGSTTLTARKRCAPVSGKIKVCNAAYGKNGWLGIAEIWIQGSHIVQARTKLNDSYFSRSPYNTSAWRNLVTCQEIGHNFGLDHQDETFGNANLGSCMDYTNSPGTNQHPNAHDYEQLASIYSHLDGSTTSPQKTGTNQMGRGSHKGHGHMKVDRDGDLVHVTFILHTLDHS